MQMIVIQGPSPAYPAPKHCATSGVVGQGRPVMSLASNTRKAPVPTHHGSHQRTPEPQDSLIRDSQPTRTTDCDLVTRRPPVDAGGRWSSTLRARRAGLVDRQASRSCPPRHNSLRPVEGDSSKSASAGKAS